MKGFFYGSKAHAHHPVRVVGDAVKLSFTPTGNVAYYISTSPNMPAKCIDVLASIGLFGGGSSHDRAMSSIAFRHPHIKIPPVEFKKAVTPV